jgi:hypothetical protein
MAKKAKCDKCKVWWRIEMKDQTPLRELECDRCGGPVTQVRSPCDWRGYSLLKGEPVLRRSCGQN